MRRAEPRDLDSIQHIEQVSFSSPWSRADLSRDISGNPVARYLVLELDGEVIGFAGAHIVLDEGHVTNVAIAPEHRGKGYSRRLAGALIQYAANLGVSYMTLEVRKSNRAAIRLYASLGFVSVSTRKNYYEEDHEDAWLMVCDSLPDADPDFEERETRRE